VHTSSPVTVVSGQASLLQHGTTIFACRPRSLASCGSKWTWGLKPSHPFVGQLIRDPDGDEAQGARRKHQQPKRRQRLPVCRFGMRRCRGRPPAVSWSFGEGSGGGIHLSLSVHAHGHHCKWRDGLVDGIHIQDLSMGVCSAQLGRRPSRILPPARSRSLSPRNGKARAEQSRAEQSKQAWTKYHKAQARLLRRSG
jgi:hypothetical protein